jgi:hypothetical protein
MNIGCDAAFKRKQQLDIHICEGIHWTNSLLKKEEEKKV